MRKSGGVHQITTSTPYVSTDDLNLRTTKLDSRHSALGIVFNKCIVQVALYIPSQHICKQQFTNTSAKTICTLALDSKVINEEEILMRFPSNIRNTDASEHQKH